MKKKKGLTLIELLAVIAIIAILFILLIPQVSSAIDKARVAGVQTDFRSYQIAAQTYYMEEESSKTEDGFNKYLDKILQFENGKSKEENPWGNPYEYVQVGEDFKIITKKENDTENVEGFELIYKEEENSIKEEVKGFDEKYILIGQADGNNDQEEPTTIVNPNDLDNDGWNDNTYLPLGVVANTDESMFNTENAGFGDDSVMITAYGGNLKEIVIPPYLGGKKVVKIDRYAFYPKAVNSNLGRSEGPQLTSVVLPNTMIEVSNLAFNSNLINNLVLPNSLETIQNGAFVGNRMTTLKIPKNVTMLPSATFTQNPNLKLVQNCSNIEITTQFNSDPTITKEGC